ncbi:hypothetical protein [Roseibium sp. RKSG952]|uniref:ribonuclease toxin HepT-like protein n=1 Tax=Roseibium sp. RKSG952 TaxID=2529384 RepID=UPI0034CF6674
MRPSGSGDRSQQANQGARHVEKIYTGYENVTQKIAATVDQNRVQKTQDWHVALIRRMTNPYEGIRPAFLELETAQVLQKLGAFRHRGRNTYGSNLNVEKPSKTPLL